MPEYLQCANIQEKTYQQLIAYSKRIADLLTKHKDLRTSLVACLDDLLGAVYNLFYAAHHGYLDRQKPLSQQDVQNVLVRANDMAQCKVRMDEKWTAGVYFNNALFRLAGVYHRTLKTVSARPTSREIASAYLPSIQKRFESAANQKWDYTKIQRIYHEVNDLKHTAAGVFKGRSIMFEDGVGAVDELLILIEVLG